MKIHQSEHSEFTPGRSTINAILALILLSELHREFNHPLNAVYLDIKAAFEFVDSAALWEASRAEGMPDILLKQIADDSRTWTSAIGLYASEFWSE